MKTSNYQDVYSRIYDEIIYYMNNKTVKINDIEFNIINFNEHNTVNLIEDYITIQPLEEDKMDEYIKYRNFNHKEDSIILFNIPVYIIENLKSYKFDPANIWDQFEKDCNRNNISINGIPISNKADIIQHIPNIKIYTVKINHHIFNLLTIIAMLCNQSSYAFPYIFITKLQKKFGTNLLASNCPDNRSINIETIKQQNKISLKFTIATDIIMRNMLNYQIDTKINISLLLETEIIQSTNLENLFKPHGLFFLNFYSDK